jgi:hypothetical protein
MQAVIAATDLNVCFVEKCKYKKDFCRLCHEGLSRKADKFLASHLVLSVF